MNLDEYIKNLQRFAVENPEALSEDVIVIHASDDEGNGHHKVIFTPTLGNYDGDSFNDDPKPEEVNAVCIN